MPQRRKARTMAMYSRSQGGIIRFFVGFSQDFYRIYTPSPCNKKTKIPARASDLFVLRGDSGPLHRAAGRNPGSRFLSACFLSTWASSKHVKNTTDANYFAAGPSPYVGVREPLCEHMLTTSLAFACYLLGRDYSFFGRRSRLGHIQL